LAYSGKGTTAEEKKSAREWVRINVSLDNKRLKSAFKYVYGSGWAYGQADANSVLDATVGFDWDNWQAGDETSAALVDAPRGLKTLLDKSGVVIKDMDEVTLDRIGSALANSLSQGLGAEDTANSIDYVLDDPARAMVIARTETTRALIDSNIERYTEAGTKELMWVVADPIKCVCVDLDGMTALVGEEFDFGITKPPAHPNCVCTLSPVSPYDTDVVPMDEYYADREPIDLAANPDVVKYSDDQPRDANGRWGSGGVSAEDAKEGHVESTHAEALRNIWHRVLTTTADGIGSVAANTIAEEDMTTENSIAAWADEIYMRQAVKATVANDLVQQETMQAVPTQSLIQTAAGGFANAYGAPEGEGTPKAGSISPDWLAALEPQQDETTDEEGTPSGIHIVEFNSNGDLTVDDYSNYINTQGLRSGEVTVDQVARGIDELNNDSDGSFRYAVAGTPEAEALVREAATSTLINQWAQTSNDENPCSLAMQEAAAEQFGLDNAAEWSGMISEVKTATDAAYEANGEVYRAFLQAQYDNTQSQLKAAGIDSITVYRGSNLAPDDGAEVYTRPMSSWSTSFKTALDFTAGADSSTLFRATINADQILSTAGTGFGCLNEFEVVTLGGLVDAEFIPSKGIDREAYVSETSDGDYAEDGDKVNELFAAKGKA